MSAYLFAHFSSGKHKDLESIWFSVSRDGLHWTDLGGEKPFLSSRLGTTGVRDPFILYDSRVKKYFIIATDLLTESGNWGDFSSRGSKSIVVWESEDLINWSDERLVEVGIAEAGCVWAPEAVFCEEKNMWFVFWASNVKEGDEKEAKQRIYGSFTDDFVTFSEPFKFIDAKTAVIDTNIVRDNEMYYRFSKDETNKFITVEKCPVLTGEKYETVYSELFASVRGLEGPEAYFLDERNAWCVIADQYSTNSGYTPFLCDDLSSGVFRRLNPGEYSMGKRKKRHGSILKITDSQADMLVEHLGISE